MTGPIHDYLSEHNGALPDSPAGFCNHCYEYHPSRCAVCGWEPSQPTQPNLQETRKMMADSAEPEVQKKRKKVTTKRIPREHAGKVTEPYTIMERLIAEVEHFAPLAKAKIVMLWKWGWRPDADGILIRARIKKASDLDKELGDEFDYAILLSAELWKETRISDEAKEIDVYHELCHAAPEMDRDGNQRKDDRDRLCWRLRKHPIQEFPECLKRYGLKKIIGLNAAALVALDDVKRREEAKAEENDANRPLLQEAEKGKAKGNGQAASDWRRCPISALQLHNGKLSDKAVEALESADMRTCGELQAAMTRHGDFWAKNTGVHGRYKVGVEDALTAMVTNAEAGDATA